MKILHIITGLGDGGAEAVLFRMCEFDVKNEHIVISLRDEGKYGPLLKQIDIPVHALNFHRGNLSALKQLYNLIKNEKPDVVQTWMYHADLIGGVIARFAGIRSVIWGVHQSTLIKGQAKSLTIFVAKLNAFLSRFVPRKIIYCAEKSRVVQESIGFESSKGVVVPNGYNINYFEPNTMLRKVFRDELGLSENTVLIGHVGRFHQFKDYPNFIQAVGLLEQQKFLQVAFVGTGLDDKNDNLVSLINQFCSVKNIRLLGRRGDIYKVMNGFDLFVLSSSSEAFPNVLNEAMACGTPCVTTDVGDAAVIVDSTGWVVPPKDPQALSDAIFKAIAEKQTYPQSWQQRRIDCRNRIVENFSIEKMIKSYHQVWES